MKPTFGRIDADIPEPMPDELVELLAMGDNVAVKRIVSHGHTSPADFWYDQDMDEWVIVLAGAGKLQFYGSDERFKMIAGDYVHIPAGVKHRVEWTDPAQETVWLAIHFKS